MLTEEQKKAYVMAPETCPYCGTKDEMEAGPIHADGKTGECNVVCNHCKNEWFDIWTLTNIQEE